MLTSRNLKLFKNLKLNLKIFSYAVIQVSQKMGGSKIVLREIFRQCVYVGVIIKTTQADMNALPKIYSNSSSDLVNEKQHEFKYKSSGKLSPSVKALLHEPSFVSQLSFWCLP